MGKLLAALANVTGLRKFFSGVTVEIPAYFLPNFRVVEMQDVKRGERIRRTPRR